VSSPSTVGIDDDFAAGQTGVTLWSTDDEQARWLDLDVIRIICAKWNANQLTW
jgi:hypothetical protein